MFGEVDEAESPALTAYRAATRATEALRAGITTIRCVHEQNRADLLLRTAVERGWYAAPRIFGAGRAVSTPGGHGAGGGCAYASGEQAFYEAALAELAAGADHVKVFISGGLNRAGEDLWRPEMTDGEIRGAVRAADEHDSYVVAHSGGTAVIQQARRQGVRCFEHIYQLDDETAALLGIGDHVGQIRPRYAADFVAVASDPLDDLAAMRTISLVVQGGRVVREDAA